MVIAAILFGTAVLAYFLSLRLGDIARQNQAYDKFIACVLSVPALDRDENKISDCYDKAQNNSNVKIIRFDGE